MTLGKHQLDLLSKLMSPKAALVVGDKLAFSLAKRGLLKSDDGASFFHITPAGLRVLADALEDGRVKGFDPADYRKRKDT